MNKQTNNQVATKKDVQVIRTDFRILRSEFKSTKKSLFEQMLKLEEKIEKVDDKLGAKIDKIEDRLGVKIDKVLTAVSNFSGRVQDLENENTIGTDHTRELRVEVDKHEKRIEHLESQVSST